MAIDQERLHDIFGNLGAAFRKRVRLCLVGSAPAILRGQLGRRTQGIDVWGPSSTFEAAALSKACAEAGIRFITEEPGSDGDYLRVLQPEAAALPTEFELVELGRYGKLNLAMPDALVLAAAKLARATVADTDDVVWWLRESGADIVDLEQAIARIPSATHRDHARNHLYVARLVARDSR